MKMKLLGFLLVATLPLLSFKPKAAKKKGYAVVTTNFGFSCDNLR
jgi:hypothetical protein